MADTKPDAPVTRTRVVIPPAPKYGIDMTPAEKPIMARAKLEEAKTLSKIADKQRGRGLKGAYAETCSSLAIVVSQYRDLTE